MVDLDTFLTALYVTVDDFCKAHLPAETRPGPTPSLTRSEVISLALLSVWGRWRSQRDFYRFARSHLRPAFPSLPVRSQFNRLWRRHSAALARFTHYPASMLLPHNNRYEVLDSTALPVRNANRRGHSWFFGLGNVGHSGRIGWFYGFRLLTSVNPVGAITGWGIAKASESDQPLNESFMALRHKPQAGYEHVGQAAGVPYLGDAGFAGKANQKRWREQYKAEVISPPQSNSARPWSWEEHRWFARLRQITETVNDKLHNHFGLERARQHTLGGLHARIASSCGLHNFCIWFNRLLGRKDLAFADLIDW